MDKKAPIIVITLLAILIVFLGLWLAIPRHTPAKKGSAAIKHPNTQSILQKPITYIKNKWALLSQPQKQTVVLDDFEDAKTDFDWQTNGYVVLKPSNQHVKSGLMSCQATFKIPSDFNSSDSTAVPFYTEITNISVSAKSYSKLLTITAISQGNLPVTWKSTMVLSTQSLTPLSVYDWSTFKSLKVSVYNPQNKTLTLELSVIDSKDYIYSQTFKLDKNKDTLVVMDLNQLTQNSLSTDDIKAVEFSLDTTNETSNPVLYFDDFYLSSI